MRPSPLPMRSAMNIGMSAMAAVAAQPLLFLLRLLPDYLLSPQPLYGVGFVLVAVAAVSTAAVFVLGVPAFLALRKLRRDSWGSLALVGLVLGAFPAAVFWPSRIGRLSAAQNWHGKYIETYVDGVPTLYAWLTYAEGVAFFALHGLVGALAFYGVWRWRERSNRSP